MNDIGRSQCQREARVHLLEERVQTLEAQLDTLEADEVRLRRGSGQACNVMSHHATISLQKQDSAMGVVAGSRALRTERGHTGTRRPGRRVRHH